MSCISVIVPVYKVESYLRRCVDSILAQTFTDFDLILVDDGSPDNCPAICDEYAGKDSRIHVIHQQNGGLSAARNAGIDWAFANSDSQWLTFIDSDDWIHQEMFLRLLNAAREFSTEVSVCSYLQTNSSASCPTDNKIMKPEIWKTEDFFVEHNINATIACAKLYHKECFQDIRFPVGVLHEDEFTTSRILFKYDCITFIDAPMYYYFTNPNGIVASAWRRKRMSAYDALEGRISFFWIKGFKLAHRAIIRRYLCSVTDKIRMLSANYEENKEVLRALKQRKRKNFKQFARVLDVNDDKDAWVLTKVYPRQMWLFWHMKAFTQKLKKIRKNGAK